jgi:hypothetical protein
MDEPLVDLYYNKLVSGEESHIKVLQTFCRVLYPDVSYDGYFYGRFNKLINLFGDRLIFFSLLDCTSSISEPKDVKHLVNLISYFAKKRFEDKNSSSPSKDLSSFVDKVKKGSDPKKLKIPEVE